MNQPQKQTRFAVCVKNDQCDDLQIWKLYQLLADEKAAKEGLVRAVDDSGEDYLYPHSCFVTIELPETTTRQLIAAIPAVA